MWQYHAFLLGMVRREFEGRYLNSLFGSLWAFVAPLAMIFIYTVVFSQVMRARLPGVDDTLAYGLYLCAGILPWNAFAEVLLRCQTIFLEHANLLKKTSFPRAILPAVVFLSAALNFTITAFVFILVLLAFGRFPGPALVALLPVFLLQQLFALGLGVLLGVLNVFFRDVAQVVGVVVQFWFWFTPIVYSLSILPASTRRLFAINPMADVVSAYQGAVLRGAWPDWSRFAPHVLGTAAALWLAVFTFHRLSGDLVDEL
jgi:lipopolysaccharide transport system permease protein